MKPAALAFDQADAAPRTWNTLTRREFFAVLTASAGAALTTGCGSGWESSTTTPDNTASGAPARDRATIAAVTSAAVVTAAQASFAGLDATTQGAWKGIYGADGGAIVGDSTAYPAYASVTSAGTGGWVWAPSTRDARAPLKAASTDRVAGCWYAAGNFTLDVNLTDGASHRVALYCLDWDSTTRAMTIDVLDAGSGAVLDSRSVTAFNAGKYAVWDVSGHVRFRVARNGGANAVVSGVFFSTPTAATPAPAPAPAPAPTPAPAPGPASAPPPAVVPVAFIGADTATRGAWPGVYGADGRIVVGNSSVPADYAQVTATGKADWTWASSTSDTRALQKVGNSDRVAACWYAGSSMSVDINITDGQTHRVAVYFLDWDNGGRSQSVQVLDAATGAVLDTRLVSAFSGGVYLVWDLSGHVVLKVLRGTGPNAILSGIFVGGSATPTPAPAPVPVAYSIGVSWAMPQLNTDGTALTDIVAYEVRYGLSASNLTQSLRVQGASSTSTTISGLAAGTYYFAVATVNAAGALSDPTMLVTKTVP